jgi:thiol-disulfide isomerase/thioredoxin
MKRPSERGQLCPRDSNSTGLRTRLSALLLADDPRLRCAVSKSWLLSVNRRLAETSRCDIPARTATGGIVAPLNVAPTAQRAVPAFAAARFMDRMRVRNWSAALPMLLLCALGVLPITAEEPAVKVGDVFPALQESALEGEVPKDLKGKLVIVDFWASWCGPCRGTFPLMEELHRRLGKRGLVIVAVNEDKSRVAMTEFLKQHPVSFTVVRDAKKKLAARVNVAMLPASYILDGEGRVLAIRGGERTMGNRAEFIRLIEDLLEKHNTRKP